MAVRAWCPVSSAKNRGGTRHFAELSLFHFPAFPCRFRFQALISHTCSQPSASNTATRKLRPAGCSRGARVTLCQQHRPSHEGKTKPLNQTISFRISFRIFQPWKSYSLWAYVYPKSTNQLRALQSSAALQASAAARCQLQGSIPIRALQGALLPWAVLGRSAFFITTTGGTAAPAHCSTASLLPSQLFFLLLLCPAVL